MTPIKTKIYKDINFFRSETSAGICICFAVLFSLLVNNSSASIYYLKFFESVVFSFAKQKFTITDFINNVFMLLFFLLMAIELKKEFLIGELTISKRAIFSVFASMGSILGAIIVFYITSYNKLSNIDGFLTSCLTDGVLFYCLVKLCGNFFNNKIIAIVLAITAINNAVFIILISTFYNSSEYVYLFLLASIFVCFFIFKYCNFYNIYAYILTAGVLWFLLWLCNVPQVLAAVVLGFFIPLQHKHKPIAIKIVKNISPIVDFFVLPIFIFANTGLNFDNFQFEYLLQPMIISVVLSVLVGKQMGFLLFIFMITKLKITQLPAKTSWLKVYCLAIFSSASFSCGLFFNSVLFKEDVVLLNQTKLSLMLVNFFIAIFGLSLVFIIDVFRKK